LNIVRVVVFLFHGVPVVRKGLNIKVFEVEQSAIIVVRKEYRSIVLNSRAVQVVIASSFLEGVGYETRLNSIRSRG